MHVLHYIDSLRLEEGGIVRATLDLTAALARAGARVTLLTGDDRDAPAAWGDAPDAPRVATLPVGLGPLAWPGSRQRDLRRLVGEADVVHLHELWDPFNLAVVGAARRARKPYVFSVHGMLDDWCMAEKGLKKRWYLRTVARRLLEGAAFAHFTAAGEAEQSLRRVPRAKALVAPLLIDADPALASVGPERAREAFPAALDQGGAPRLLFLGRLHPIKGLPMLLAALERLGSACDAHVVLAGPVEDRHDADLRRQADGAGLGDRVHFVGMVQGELKQSLYRAADAFVLPSHHENFGLALVEAMLAGVPVLTSRSVNIWPEVERHGGIVVDPTVEGFAAGLRTLLTDLPARKGAAEGSRAAVHDWVNPTRLTERYLAAYREVVGRAAERG